MALMSMPSFASLCCIAEGLGRESRYSKTVVNNAVTSKPSISNRCSLSKLKGRPTMNEHICQVPASSVVAWSTKVH